MFVKETLEQISTQAKAKAKPDPVKYGTLSQADYHRQGDVYFVCISADLEAVLKRSKKAVPMRQLAPGETQGSRHIIREADMSHLTFYTRTDATPLDGPIIVASKPFTVDHPEHGSVTLPAGTYSGHYQRQYAEELRRVAD